LSVKPFALLLNVTDQQIHGKLVQAVEDEKRREERRKRHRMEDLRSALRKVDAIKLEMTYEEVSPWRVVDICVWLTGL
jgi:hypothetical protein